MDQKQSVLSRALEPKRISDGYKKAIQALRRAKREYAIARGRWERNRKAGWKNLVLAFDLDIKTKRLHAARAAVLRHLQAY